MLMCSRYWICTHPCSSIFTKTRNPWERENKGGNGQMGARERKKEKEKKRQDQSVDPGTLSASRPPLVALCRSVPEPVAWPRPRCFSVLPYLQLFNIVGPLSRGADQIARNGCRNSSFHRLVIIPPPLHPLALSALMMTVS